MISIKSPFEITKDIAKKARKKAIATQYKSANFV